MGYYGIKARRDRAQKPATLNQDYAIDPHSPYPYFVDTGTLLVDQGNVAKIKR